MRASKPRSRRTRERLRTDTIVFSSLRRFYRTRDVRLIFKKIITEYGNKLISGFQGSNLRNSAVRAIFRIQIYRYLPIKLLPISKTNAIHLQCTIDVRSYFWNNQWSCLMIFVFFSQISFETKFITTCHQPWVDLIIIVLHYILYRDLLRVCTMDCGAKSHCRVVRNGTT